MPKPSDLFHIRPARCTPSRPSRPVRASNTMQQGVDVQHESVPVWAVQDRGQRRLLQHWHIGVPAADDVLCVQKVPCAQRTSSSQQRCQHLCFRLLSKPRLAVCLPLPVLRCAAGHIVRLNHRHVCQGSLLRFGLQDLPQAHWRILFEDHRLCVEELRGR